MKRHCLVSVLVAAWTLLCAASAVAGSVPTNFAGVPWGTPQEKVRQIVSARGWQPFGDGFIGEFAGFPGVIKFQFTANAMTGGSAELQRMTYGGYLKTTFDAAYKLLSEKYGPTAIKAEPNPDKTSSMPGCYAANWELIDSATAEKYSIALFTMDSLYMMDGTRLYVVLLVYENASLVERSKKSGF